MAGVRGKGRDGIVSQECKDDETGEVDDDCCRNDYCTEENLVHILIGFLASCLALSFSHDLDCEKHQVESIEAYRIDNQLQDAQRKKDISEIILVFIEQVLISK